MKKNPLSLLSFAQNGIGTGIPVTLLCMTLIGGYNPIIREFLIWTVASALFGIYSGLISKRSERLNLPSAMALHCALCLVTATAAGALCGYSDSFVELLLGILPVFVVVYAVIYGLSIASMKRYEKRINEALNQE